MNFSDLNISQYIPGSHPESYVLVEDCRNLCLERNLDVSFYPFIYSCIVFGLYMIQTIDFKNDAINKFTTALFHSTMVLSIIANLIMFLFKVI